MSAVDWPPDCECLVAALDGVIVPVQCEYLALEGSPVDTDIERVRSASSGLIVAACIDHVHSRTNVSTDVVTSEQNFPNQVFRSVGASVLAEAPPMADIEYAPGSVVHRPYEPEGSLKGDGVKVPLKDIWLNERSGKDWTR